MKEVFDKWKLPLLLLIIINQINELHVCVPSISHVEMLTPSGMVLGDGTFGR